ncbi:rCG52993 [Rattus norvegicus]|uniref:Predicted gene 5485 n=2 Tax=Rattus norvegicus TaxID=10116 RepID=A0A8I6GE82_RAT|nr:rCG52993 [Rattus norvegicus]
MAYKLLQAAVCSTLLIEVLGAPFLMEDPANQFLRLKRQVVHLQDFWGPDHHPDEKEISLADEAWETWTSLKASAHRYFDTNTLAFDISAVP